MKLPYVVLVFLLLISSASSGVAGGCGRLDHAHSSQERAEKNFGQMDLNDDEVVDRSEFEKSQVSKMIRSFDALQPNANGLLTKENFIGTFMRYHSKIYTSS